MVPYASAIGKFMSAMLCMKPDICFAVGIMNRYQLNLGLKPCIVFKHIFKYLQRMMDYVFVF